MTKFLKKLAVVLGVLIISSGIFFLISEDQELKEDVFNRSLRLLGEQFISLIPESEDAAIVEGKWQDFTTKANNGEIPPEQVERVAIGILNASNLNKDISVNDAEVLLNLALSDAGDRDEYAKNSNINKQSESNALPDKNIEPIDPEEIRAPEIQKEVRDVKHKDKLVELGKELAAVCEFNQKIQESCEADTSKRQLFVQNFRYKLDNGIRLSADVGLRKKLKEAKFKEWQQGLENLDKKQLVEWRHNFAMELDKKNQQIKLQIDSLKMIINSQNIQIGESFKMIFGDRETQEALKSLEKLQYWQAVDANTFEKMVYEKLKNLNIKIEKN